jgi:hypothetical protein
MDGGTTAPGTLTPGPRPDGDAADATRGSDADATVLADGGSDDGGARGDAGGEADAATDGPCSDGARRCAGRSPETCEGGSWVTEPSCPLACVAGECGGTCFPGHKQCDGRKPQVCSPRGEWATGAACAFGCVDGECTGTCAEGDRRCDGLVPQTCNARGEWVASPACAFVCEAGACAGECKPGSSACRGDTPLRCDERGRFSAAATCGGETPYCVEGSCSRIPAVGSFSSGCVVARSGELRCWFPSGSYRTQTQAHPRSTPLVRAFGLEHNVQHHCVVTTAGGVACAGENEAGALGSGEPFIYRSTELRNVVGLSHGVASVAVYFKSSCALLEDSSVRCWGEGAGRGLQSFSPVTPPGLESGVRMVGISQFRTCAVMTNGSFRCLDTNSQAPVARDIPLPGKAVWLGQSAPALHECLVLEDGRVACTGLDDHGQLGPRAPGGNSGEFRVVEGVADAQRVAVGRGHTCILTTAGGVRCWGSNTFGQLGDGTADRTREVRDVVGLTSGAVAIACGANHACALLADGRVMCWGANSIGELGNGTGVGSPVPVLVPGVSR